MRPSARPASATTDLVALPKVHLHLHLTGSMRPATLAELAARDGVAVPSALASAAPAMAPGDGWTRFEALYRAAKSVLRRPEDLVRLVQEIAEDEAAAGSSWVEVSVNPANYGTRFGPPAAVLDLLLDAGRAATAATGIGIGWIVVADRTRSGDDALALARIAAARAGDGVVGFGLASDERLGPAPAFAAAFALARAGGLLSVPHAGELRGAVAVAEALDHLAPARIGHGVRAAEDREVVARLADTGTCLEVCLTSNVALGVSTSHDAHQLRTLLDGGCRVALGADDPLLFGARLLDEYRTARHVLGLDDAALAAVAAAGIDASAAPEALKARLRARLSGWRSTLAATA